VFPGAVYSDLQAAAGGTCSRQNALLYSIYKTHERQDPSKYIQQKPRYRSISRCRVPPGRWHAGII